MKKSELELIGVILFVSGLLCAWGGRFASNYSVLHIEANNHLSIDYPYAKYALGMIVAGCVLIVIGIVLLFKAHERREMEKPTQATLPKPPS